MSDMRSRDDQALPEGATGQQDTSAPSKGEARKESIRQQSEVAASRDGTDEDREQVDTSHIGYETPMGEKEPSA